MTFELHPQLHKDCYAIGDLTLCRLLLMNDKNYPWFILIPMRNNKREIYELNAEDQIQLNTESIQLSRFLMEKFKGEKMNIAALGNMVPQLHIHHIVRYKNDPAWPGPVWGKATAIAYTEKEVETIKQHMRDFFQGLER